ncbi:beta-propeller fold lactonase family protein [Mycolicibacterium psychrotolerans]|uniref:beta-propeller fold lactonase family protein n=1 Tax=Mycolicibacterium psychrotolerans TaxID=216929 RepID=UPI003D66BB9A
MTDRMENKRVAAQRCEPVVWLGAGALTLGIGAAALIGGTGLAHADNANAAGSAKTSVGSAAPHAGPKVTAHRTPAKAPLPSAPRPVAAVHKPAAAASPVTTASAEVAVSKVVKTPLQVLCDGSVRVLVALGGMNQTTPTPAPGNLWQQGLYSVARWLEDTVNPAGIPKIQAVSLGAPDQLTGVVTGRIVSTNAAGAPLSYQVTVDPKLGKVTVNPDGSFTFTPLTSTVLGAPSDGLTVKMKVSAINGVQRASQTVSGVVNNPWALVKQTVTVGTGPLGIAVSPDGTRAVVSNSGDGTVSLINTSTNKVLATIGVGSTPAGVVFDPSGSRFYVVNATGAVTAVSLPANTVGAPVAVGVDPLLAAIGPAGTPAAGKLYVTNFGLNGTGNTVSVLNTATNQVTATITLPAPAVGPQGVAMSPDGTRVWVGSTQGKTVSVIDTATNTVIKTLPLSTEPGFIAFSPDGHLAYIADFAANTVSVINTANYTTAATIPVGQYPTGMALSPDGSVAFVTNQMDNTVSVINTATKTVIKTVTVGNTPVNVAVSPDGHYIYVANLLGGTVTVVPV